MLSVMATYNETALLLYGTLGCLIEFGAHCCFAPWVNFAEEMQHSDSCPLTPLLTKRDGHRNVGDQFPIFWYF